MNIGKAMAIGQIVLCVGAMVGYFLAKDYWRALYWFAALIIAVVLTFGKMQ